STGMVPFRMEQQWQIRLKLALAEEATLARQITSTGRVVPAARNRAIVAPPVGGIISGAQLPRVGQEVTRGQLLTTLTQTPTAAEAAQIHIENSRMEAERRRLAQAEIEARAKLAAVTHNLERAKRLYEKKAYSAKALESDELDRTAAETQLGAIREQLQALQTPPLSASAYEVYAPIAGTIVTVHKSPGEQVAAGEAILEIVNLDTVWVEAPIFERDLARLRLQKSATFTTAAFADMEFRGALINLGAVIDEQTRAATVMFEVPNPAKKLRIGMQANVRMDADESVKAVLIPKEAILDNEGEKIVYVFVSGETFQRRHVELGDEHGDKVAVLDGVMPGQRVVTQGAYQLKLQELRPADEGAHTHEV
ncbi:MAG: efflux RND transporter periplasmic adaptor subunit, partial [Acidobacteria bacterium]|nr:efflux RND transporter periplasmic adaptor subunit [Acidobacteriota bacterium]